MSTQRTVPTRPEPGPPGPPRPPAPPKRRRRPARRPVALFGVAAVAIGAGVAASGVALEGSVEEVEAGTIRKATVTMRENHRRAVRKALKAPTVLGVKRAKLERIAECESHGDPRAVSSDGTYRGKYQFDKSTWRSNGGVGKDPAKASELEQDMTAAALYRTRGSSPWPNCG